MNAVELRSKSLDDLEQELLNLRREQFNLSMQRSTGPVSYTHLRAHET